MAARTSISDKKLTKALDRVNRAQARFWQRYPGDSGARQAVHTVYGGAHLFSAETPKKLGELAMRAQLFSEVSGRSVYMVRAPEAERGASRDTLQLVRQQWGVRAHDDDDRQQQDRDCREARERQVAAASAERAFARPAVAHRPRLHQRPRLARPVPGPGNTFAAAVVAAAIDLPAEQRELAHAGAGRSAVAAR